MQLQPLSGKDGKNSAHIAIPGKERGNGELRRIFGLRNSNFAIAVESNIISVQVLTQDKPMETPL